jgi:hypothetical protein
MRRITSGRVALGISVTALFVALGGTAFAVTQIGTNQIQNGAVTTPKLHDGAVTNSKLANNSVGNAKIKDNSITSNKVKSNTFLPANGTAADSNRLGGLLPADFIQGVGFVTQRRISVPANSSGNILINTSLGTFTATCTAGNQPQVTWSPNVNDAEYAATITSGSSSATTVRLVTLNGITTSGSDPEPLPATGPFSINYQIGTTIGGLDKVVSANITGRQEGATCVFIGQELSSGD